LGKINSHIHHEEVKEKRVIAMKKSPLKGQVFNKTPQKSQKSNISGDYRATKVKMFKP